MKKVMLILTCSFFLVFSACTASSVPEKTNSENSQQTSQAYSNQPSVTIAGEYMLPRSEPQTYNYPAEIEINSYNYKVELKPVNQIIQREFVYADEIMQYTPQWILIDTDDIKIKDFSSDAVLSEDNTLYKIDWSMEEPELIDIAKNVKGTVENLVFHKQFANNVYILEDNSVYGIERLTDETTMTVMPNNHDFTKIVSNYLYLNSSGELLSLNDYDFSIVEKNAVDGDARVVLSDVETAMSGINSTYALTNSGELHLLNYDGTFAELISRNVKKIEMINTYEEYANNSCYYLTKSGTVGCVEEYTDDYEDTNNVLGKGVADIRVTPWFNSGYNNEFYQVEGLVQMDDKNIYNLNKQGKIGIKFNLDVPIENVYLGMVRFYSSAEGDSEFGSPILIKIDDGKLYYSVFKKDIRRLWESSYQINLVNELIELTSGVTWFDGKEHEIEIMPAQGERDEVVDYYIKVRVKIVDIATNEEKIYTVLQIVESGDCLEMQMMEIDEEGTVYTHIVMMRYGEKGDGMIEIKLGVNEPYRQYTFKT